MTGSSRAMLGYKKYINLSSRFVGLAARTISDGLPNTMKTVCEILAESPEGVTASIKLETFKEIYTFLFEKY